MKREVNWKWLAQCLVVLGCGYALKRYYSSASADQLRWILAPTTALVELVSGVSFEFEAHAGYLSRERGFLIANSCAGVNFLLTAFLLLAFGRLLRNGARALAWHFIPAAALVAYLVTLLANATRIAIALQLQHAASGLGGLGGLNPAQVHRFEGIVIYFGFLLGLFVVSEKMAVGNVSSSSWLLFLPLFVYYATMLGIPLATGAYRREGAFWEHSLTVLLLPLILMLPFSAFYLLCSRKQLGARRQVGTLQFAYSHRKATNGSTRAARRAGITQASNATASSTTATAL
ncbi:MAG: exosortase K [Acidobacteria bacterium]|nr:exosortase K [Acidobacteriota bacterium]MBI3423515.1 exosortase K [Acidobacteriota bacterium]